MLVAQKVRKNTLYIAKLQIQPESGRLYIQVVVVVIVVVVRQDSPDKNKDVSDLTRAGEAGK